MLKGKIIWENWGNHNLEAVFVTSDDRLGMHLESQKLTLLASIEEWCVLAGGRSLTNERSLEAIARLLTQIDCRSDRKLLDWTNAIRLQLEELQLGHSLVIKSW